MTYRKKHVRQQRLATNYVAGYPKAVVCSMLIFSPLFMNIVFGGTGFVPYFVYHIEKHE
jgi:hypothetical protein